MSEMKVYPLILAGGSGTRFWPLSREEWPKQLLNISGNGSLVAQAVSRAGLISGSERIYIVAGSSLAEKIRMVLLNENLTFVIEPAAKNTAPAIALAAKAICDREGDGIMVVLPSDHVILEEERFIEGVSRAIEGARRDYMVTLGITPTAPETGYGYVKAGAPLFEGVFEVKRFTEKPDRERAEQFLEEGGYYWNGGMFIWKASIFLEEVKTHLPELFDVIGKYGKDDEKMAEEFSGLEGISVDYGVMEKAKNVAVVPCSFTWSDVGSWAALDDIFDKDMSGNVVRGNVIPIECNDSIFYGGEELMAAVGLQEMIVVSTGDATLVVPKKRAQDVRNVARELKERGAREGVEHRTVTRPWGSYTVLLTGERFKIKKVEVSSGKRLSLQMHHHRSEHWVVVRGSAKVTKGDEEYVIQVNESTYIPKETKHRIENPGQAPLWIIEVQNGEYVGEDDIVRFQDDFGRQ